MSSIRTLTRFVSAAACGLPAALILNAARPAAAQGYTYQNLASFDGSGSTGGSDPRTRLTLLGDTLYGTTFDGGANEQGTVFSLPTTGGQVTTLASFSGTYGTGPSALTPSTDGQTLFGTTEFYGTPSTSTDSDGAVFSVSTGGGITTLAAFDAANGADPVGGVTLSADGTTLYGVTQFGGDLTLNSGQGYGEIFSVPVAGGIPTVLGTFNGTNGESPLGGLTLIGGTLYGTASAGGTNSDGAVFSIPVAGGQITDLASFNDATGYNPEAGLTLSGDGKTLFGITPIGGPQAGDGGTVFSVPVAGGQITVLAGLTGANSNDPSSRLALSADGETLFGTTEGNGRFDRGSVFSVPTTGGPLTTLVQFTAGGSADGSLPQGGVTLGPDGILYGTTSLGGNGSGNVYALIPNATPEPSQSAALGLGALGLSLLSFRARRRAVC